MVLKVFIENLENWQKLLILTNKDGRQWAILNLTGPIFGVLIYLC